MDLKVEYIPGVKPLDRVYKDPRYDAILRRRKFYTVNFSKGAEHDYLITDTAILVDRSSINDDLTREMINTSINLNL